jgi:ketosteroid isomerase-like protein
MDVVAAIIGNRLVIAPLSFRGAAIVRGAFGLTFEHGDCRLWRVRQLRRLDPGAGPIKARTNPMQDFETFMRQRETASTAFVEGDASALLAISTQHDPATIFPPTGTCIDSADAVNSENTRGAKSFGPDAQNRFEVMHSGSSGELAYWTGVQRSTVRMLNKPEQVRMSLRVTEIFRLEDGNWRLFHRHADMFKD